MEVDASRATLVGPDDGATLVSVVTDAVAGGANTTLEWAAPSEYAGATYRVYSGTTAGGMSELTLGSNTDTLVDPSPVGDLAFEEPYEWRVDSYEPNEVGTILHTGDVWSFSTAHPNPVITLEPASITASLPLDLTIEVSNGEVYTWYDGAGNLLETHGALTVAKGADSFTVTADGKYYCVVSNDATTPESDVTSATVRVMEPALVGHWNFDENLTDTVNGFVGVYVDPNILHAPPTAVYTDVIDVNNLTGAGQALILDGNTDNCFVKVYETAAAVVDSNEFYNFYPQGYTVNAWAKMSEGSYGALVSKQGLGKGQGVLLNHFGGSAIHTLRSVSVIEPASVNNDLWHMITGTYEPVSRKITLYVDGVEIDSAIKANPASTNDQPLIFGTGVAGGDSFPSSPYSGLLDEVRIWNYPVDAVEIGFWYLDHAPLAELCLVDVAGLDSLEWDIAGGPVDIDGNPTPDCKVGLDDMAIIIAEWLNCRDVPNCLLDPRS